jgi:hypothetical protein
MRRDALKVTLSLRKIRSSPTAILNANLSTLLSKCCPGSTPFARITGDINTFHISDMTEVEAIKYMNIHVHGKQLRVQHHRETDLQETITNETIALFGILFFYFLLGIKEITRMFMNFGITE